MSFINSICFDKNGRMLQECETVEIDNHGCKVRVKKLSDLEAKAYISMEYGFEMGAIWIEGPCWYDATDWNYFRFSVRGWHYEVRDFGPLQIVD
ncbi:MAG: hypothetical protein PWQ93_369 [Clostridiales bacterium]|nr:hypothetical protein [Clostridiales bacterium]